MKIIYIYHLKGKSRVVYFPFFDKLAQIFYIVFRISVSCNLIFMNAVPETMLFMELKSSPTHCTLFPGSLSISSEVNLQHQCQCG